MSVTRSRVMRGGDAGEPEDVPAQPPSLLRSYRVARNLLRSGYVYAREPDLRTVIGQINGARPITTES